MTDGTTATKNSKRTKRFTKTLASNGSLIQIPNSWDELPILPLSAHDEVYVSILQRNGFEVRSPVPLVGRYSKARRWSAEELAACIDAHDKGIPLAIMSAALNRNPQDIIYRLLDECSDSTRGFTQVGLKNPKKWDDKAIAVGRELFEAGLTAWRVGAAFGVDFEGVEKALYMGRSGYGHIKKNPFGVCTDHKQVVNKAILTEIDKPKLVLDAFAGEGRFTEILCDLLPDALVTCIEQDADTFKTATTQRQWSEQVEWINDDNIKVLHELQRQGKKFDLIDLDPFVTCREQIDFIWPMLFDKSYLFLTFGGEYRRSFIGTNRKAIARRYGFNDLELSNKDYLEVIPAFFLGWVARQAALHGFVFRILYNVRYANNCRFWLEVVAADSHTCADWLSRTIAEESGGYRWRNMAIPRFAEVRNKAIALGKFTHLENKLAKSKNTKQKISHNQLGLAL